MKITGTFLDEISHDIPSSNWDAAQWAQDFASMREDGIDTVILIRAGYRELCTFESKVLRNHRVMRPAYIDLVDLFLELAERNGMKFFFGTYDSGVHWLNNEPQKEIELNIAFTQEFMERYGHRRALGGWYICHEIMTFDETALRVYERLAKHLRGLKNVPILISPYMHGAKSGGKLTPAQHEQAWRPVYGRIKGVVDIIAFQDGQVDFARLPEYLAVNARLAREHGIACWSNVESFERGMAMNFLPIGWPNMRFKMEAAQAAGVEKLITFEYSHFLGPNSIFPSAHNLNRQYKKWAAGTP
jgi:hypothetical protein